jgi:hypothetical protein
LVVLADPVFPSERFGPPAACATPASGPTVAIIAAATVVVINLTNVGRLVDVLFT